LITFINVKCIHSEKSLAVEEKPSDSNVYASGLNARYSEEISAGTLGSNDAPSPKEEKRQK